MWLESRDICIKVIRMRCMVVGNKSLLKIEACLASVMHVASVCTGSLSSFHLCGYSTSLLRSRAGMQSVALLVRLSFVRPSIASLIFVAIKPLSPVSLSFSDLPMALIGVSSPFVLPFFVWTLLSSWNISSNLIGKSKGTTLLIL